MGPELREALKQRGVDRTTANAGYRKTRRKRNPGKGRPRTQKTASRRGIPTPHSPVLQRTKPSHLGQQGALFWDLLSEQ
jgi:hypothetical protein